MKYTRSYARKRGNKWQAVFECHDADGKRRFNTQMLPEASGKYEAERIATELMALKNEGP